MKQLVLVPLLAVGGLLVLSGCGGRPQGTTPSALTAQLAGAHQPTPQPAPSSSNPAPAGSSAPAPQPAPAPASSALPPPPANAVVTDQIQSSSNNWTACSKCAYGTNSTTNFWMAPFQSSPSMTGSSRQLYVGGPQWTNALFIKTLPANNSATHFIWDFWVYFDDASAANIWSAEFDFWQSVGGREFMVGSQCDFGDGIWETWDSKRNLWVRSSVPCRRWAGSTWHHVQWWVERTDGDHYRYNTLVFDGNPITFNLTYETNPTGWADAMGVQWQLDQDISGHDLHEWIDNVKLTAW